jgi:tetratricopeptide (TPR) repeat protein
MKVALLAAVVLLVRVANAEPSAAAKPHVDDGVKAYTAGDWDTAVREFEIAYNINKEPALLYAWAQAHRQANRCDKALELYQRYLDSGPTDDQIAAAKTGISLCANAPKQPDPPQRVVDEQERSPWYKDSIGGALVAGGVVGVGVGVTFLVLSSNRADDADASKKREDFVDNLDKANTYRKVGLVGAGLGGALIIGGIIRYVTRSDEPTGVGVTGTASGSVVVFGRF